MATTVVALLGVVLMSNAFSATERPPAPIAVPPAVPVANPATLLEDQVRRDRPAVEGLVGRWVPQVSAKKVGLIVDGVPVDLAEVWADHQRQRGSRPAALLLWSGDFTSFRGRDFWVTVVAIEFDGPGAANAWCDAQGFRDVDCYAKRLSHRGGHTENTRVRAGS